MRLSCVYQVSHDQEAQINIIRFRALTSTIGIGFLAFDTILFTIDTELSFTQSCFVIATTVGFFFAVSPPRDSIYNRQLKNSWGFWGLLKSIENVHANDESIHSEFVGKSSSISVFLWEGELIRFDVGGLAAALEFELSHLLVVGLCILKWLGVIHKLSVLNNL